MEEGEGGEGKGLGVLDKSPIKTCQNEKFGIKLLSFCKMIQLNASCRLKKMKFLKKTYIK